MNDKELDTILIRCRNYKLISLTEALQDWGFEVTYQDAKVRVYDPTRNSPLWATRMVVHCDAELTGCFTIARLLNGKVRAIRCDPADCLYLGKVAYQPKSEDIIRHVEEFLQAHPQQPLALEH